MARICPWLKCMQSIALFYDSASAHIGTVPNVEQHEFLAVICNKMLGKLRFVDVPAMISKNTPFMEGFVQETIKKVYNTYVEYQKNT